MSPCCFPFAHGQWIVPASRRLMENHTDYQNIISDVRQTSFSSSLWAAGLDRAAKSLTIQLSRRAGQPPSPNYSFIPWHPNGTGVNSWEPQEVVSSYPGDSGYFNSTLASDFDPGILLTTIGAVEPVVQEAGAVQPTSQFPAVNQSSTGYLDNLAVAIPMGVGLYALSLLTFVGNAMVLHAIRTERRLQTVSNMFIMSLAIADLTVGMIVMPISSAYAITGDWKFGVVVCQFWLSADYTASTASILNLLILSLDRYWSIRSPLKYLRKRTKKRALIMIAIVWLVSAMWIIPIIGWHYWYNDGIRKQPSTVCETEFADNILFKLTASTANFYVPMVLMICLYVKIFYEIKKRSKFEIGQCNMGGAGSVEGNLAESDKNGDDVCGSCRSSSNGSSSNRTTDGRRTTDASGARLVRRCVGGRLQDDHFSDCTDGECYTDLVPDRTKVVKSASADSRFQHLTLVAVRSPGHEKEPTSRAQFYQQDFENVTINVEYVIEPEEKESVVIVDNRGVTVRPHRSSGGRAKCQRRETGEQLSLKKARSNIYHHRCRKKSRSSSKKSKKSKSDKIPMEDLNLEQSSPSVSAPQQQQPHSILPTEEMLQGRLTEQQLQQCRQSSGLLPNITTALKMRVTRKGFHSNLRQEKKAARQLGVIMGAFVLCWLPYIIIFIVTAYCEDCINPNFHTATIWLAYLNSAMNPFLYALCNANFKRAFRKMFRRGTKRASFCPPNTSTKTDHLFA